VQSIPVRAAPRGGEGLYPRAQFAESPPHPKFASREFRPLPASGRKRGEVKQAVRRRATQLIFARCRLARTPLAAQNRVREKSNFVNRFKRIWVVSPSRAKISLSENRKLCIVPAVPFPQEGRFAVVTDVGSGMRWTLRLCVDVRSLKRTAKSCGSGAPKQALRSRRCSRVLRVTVATKRWSPRRARVTRKTIAQGMPVAGSNGRRNTKCFFHS
jgi:hypothetical protein